MHNSGPGVLGYSLNVDNYVRESWCSYKLVVGLLVWKSSRPLVWSFVSQLILSVIGCNCASKHFFNNLPTPALILEIQTLSMILTPTPLKIFLAHSIHVLVTTEFYSLHYENNKAV